MASKNAIVKCLAVLQGQWPQIASTEMALASWQVGLGRFTDEQVTIGAELVVRYHTYGQPTAAHVTEMILGKEAKELTDSVYAVCYRTVIRFAWEERGEQPPGGMTEKEARRVLLGPPGVPGLHAPSRTDEGAGSPQRLSRLLEEGQ